MSFVPSKVIIEVTPVGIAQATFIEIEGKEIKIPNVRVVTEHFPLQDVSRVTIELFGSIERRIVEQPAWKSGQYEAELDKPRHVPGEYVKSGNL